MTSELGVLLPIGQAQWGAGADPRELVDFAVQAEELGYASLWVNDFLLSPRIEALTMLAAVAPVTRTGHARHGGAAAGAAPPGAGGAGAGLASTCCPAAGWW